MNSLEIKVPLTNMKEFGERLAKLNRKAVKLGVEKLVIASQEKKLAPATRLIEVNKTDEQRIELSQSKKFKLQWIMAITIMVPEIKLAGYQFLATLDNITGTTNIIKSVPGNKIDVDQRFRETGTICEHCNKSRYRKDMFVVRHEETGAQTQVGRQCLRDYLGHNAEDQLRALQFLSDVENLGSEESYRGGAKLYSIEDILEYTAAYNEKFGWTSKARSSEEVPSTLARVMAHYSFDNKTRMAAEKDMPVIPQAAKDKAAQTIAFVREMNAYGDYEKNVQVLLEQDVAEFKNLGLIVSAVAMMDTKLGLIETKKREAAKLAESHFVGTTGERLKAMEVTVMNVRRIDGQYGTTTLLTLLDAAGNQLVWFATKYLEAAKEQKLVIDGTVKAHKEYNGVKQTTLTNCRIKEGVAA